MKLYPQLQAFCANSIKAFHLIPNDRKIALIQLSNYILKQLQKGEPIHLVTICTHNSRRSHFAQIWAMVFADYFQLKNIRTYSGGTETTALNPRVAKTLIKSGFKIMVEHAQSSNPHYLLYWKENQEKPYIAFSKRYQDSPNPTKNFVALMVCDSASEACPIVFGSNFKLSHTYQDPKVSDNTQEETKTYIATNQLIAREMAFMLQHVKNQLSITTTFA